MRAREGVLDRFLHVGASPVRVRAWQVVSGDVHIRAEAIDPLLVDHQVEVGEARPAGQAELELAVERMRFVLALEEDMGEFFDAFRRDPLLGPVIRRQPWVRPKRQPWPWEALAWAITKQLIESSRAAQIQRRIVRAWSPTYAPPDAWPLRDVPSAAMIAGRSPAELVAMDLSEGRALAMLRCAREVAAGRAEISGSEADRRLLAVREVGPWTVQCLGLYGRGDPDSLPAGDLSFVKLVGWLAQLGRKATAEEVEEYFAPYAPFRGLAGTFALVGWHKAIPRGPALRLAGASLAAEAAAARW